MFPTKILVAVDGFGETSSAIQAAVETASSTGSELHVVHVVPRVPELPYLHLAAKERVEDFLEWRRLKGLQVLDDRVRHVREDLGGTVAASYYKEGRPEEEIAALGKEVDAALIMVGGRRQKRLERIFGANLAESLLRWADRPVLIVEDRSYRSSPVQR